MSKFFAVLTVLVGSLGAAELSPVAPVIDCGQLRAANLPDVHIGEAVEVKDGKPAPYCKVTGYVDPQVEFEVRLPLSGWTQRFLQTGCGGLCGTLNIRVGNDEGCLPAERGEFALASTDMGHHGMGGDWGDDPKLRIDFAYRGVHVTTLAAKAIIAKYYGQAAKYSYFAGCSDGGREALVEAQRFPDDFDGITAGAPAMNFTTQNTFYHAWNARMNTDAEGKAILTADKLPVLHAAAIQACDAIDGLKDGLISDPRACHFDPGVTECKTGDDPKSCLTPAQVKTAREIYQGAHDSSGKQLVISGPMVGSELAWRGVYVPNTPNQGTMSQMISLETIKHLVYTPNPPEKFTLVDFRFDEATFDAVKPMHPVYDSTNPDLTAFAARGGKLILWHGWADPHISPLNTIAYYTAAENFMGKQKTEESLRLYLFSGGYHCGGGEGPFDVNLLTPIMNWVELNKAPRELVATHVSRPDRMEGPPPGAAGPPPGMRPPGAPPMQKTAPPPDLSSGPQKADRTRPVFPYPLVAVYSGKGDINEWTSFVGKPGKEFDQPAWLGASYFEPAK